MGRSGRRFARTEEELQKLLATNVRRLRAIQDITQEQAAHQSEIAYRAYQRIEGMGGNATLRTLARLCRGFDVPVAALFKE